MKYLLVSTKTVALALLLVLSSFTHIALAKYDPTREILVYFTSGVQRVTRGQLRAANVSPALTSALSRFRITGDSIRSAFPDFAQKDTLRVFPNGKTARLMNMARVFRITVPSGESVDSVIASLKKFPNVLFAQKNMNARLFSVPTDPDFSNQWYLNNTGQSGGTPGADISAERAWSIFTGSSSTTIAIVDEGVMTNHEDLAGKASGDYSGGINGIYHGTHVAGIAAAIANNGKGGAGVNWNAKILSEEIFSPSDVSSTNPDGYMGDANAANKIIDAVNSGAQVINNSWGGSNYSATIASALAYAYENDCVVTAAMSDSYNSGNPVSYPAAFGQGIIAVGATTDNDIRSSFSGTGGYISVVAPGGQNGYPNTNEEDVFSTWGPNTNSYAYLAGTSMATPQVSGIASLLKGYDPSPDGMVVLLFISHLFPPIVPADIVVGIPLTEYANVTLPGVVG